MFMRKVFRMTTVSCSSYLRSSSTHRSNDLIDCIVKKMTSNYKIVAFDFDQTIVKVHTFFQGVTPSNVHMRSLQEDFADLYLFQNIVRKLQQNNVKVAVASFGYKKVIEAYLQAILPEESSSITILSRESGLSKRKMLKRLSKLEENYLVPADQIVLFDDDIDNIDSCTKAGFGAFHVDANFGLSQQFWKQWASSH